MNEFPSLLLGWYDKHGRDLPWRNPSPAWVRKGTRFPLRKTHDPYKILLSEIMLQQTQVPRVITKWNEWLAKFPTEKDVAQASTQQIILAWQGMGYNNRALRLKACCEHVTKNGWPTTPEGLEELPGLGRYTAHAVACFAFKQRVPIVDVNVKLVYSPFTGMDAKDDAMWDFAWKILPQKRFYDYNQALFDLGTVVKSGDMSSLPKKLQDIYKDIKSEKKKSTEKLYKGHPMRLYRGALVECLRSRPSYQATIKNCQEYIAQRLAKQSAQFIKTVAERLEKDGVITISGDRVSLR